MSCLVIDGVPPEISVYHFCACVAANTAALVLYAIIWVHLKRKKSEFVGWLANCCNLESSENTNRLFKSLATIMVNIFVGWFLMGTIRAVLLTTNANISTLFRAKWVAAAVINTTCTVNPFILFWFRQVFGLILISCAIFSNDYGEALRKELSVVVRQFKTSVHVQWINITLLRLIYWWSIHVCSFRWGHALWMRHLKSVTTECLVKIQLTPLGLCNWRKHPL